MHSICFNAPCYLLSESALIIPDPANFLQVGGIIETNMEKGLQNYGKEGYKGVTETWNIVQHEVRNLLLSPFYSSIALHSQLKCCGAQEYLDWENTTFAAESKSVPDSCCLSDVEGCGKGILSMAPDQVPKIIHPNGCLSELKEVIEGNVAALGGIGVGIAVIQVSSHISNGSKKTLMDHRAPLALNFSAHVGAIFRSLL